MKSMFERAMMFDANVSRWETGKVTDMLSMFSGAILFRGIGLDNWDVSKVQNMNSMFYGAFVLVANLSLWNTSQVTNMKEMFFVEDLTGN
jgi:surface protein